MQFLGLEDSEYDFDSARVVIIPAPFEATTSYGKGTGRGPAAILEASAQVETFDEELELEPHKCGIYTLEPIGFGKKTGKAAVDLVEKMTERVVAAGKFPFGLGGEHTVTIGFVRALLQRYPDLHIVHLDAHADMRSEYEGTPWSHACVIRRLCDLGLKYTSIGIRAISRPEFDFIKPRRSNYFFAHEIAVSKDWIDAALLTVTGHVYLTLDIDVFDSSIVPHTGTPEPGGLNWYEVTAFIKRLAGEKMVVGADLVELSPSKGSEPSDFLAAKLVNKIIGYLFNSNGCCPLSCSDIR